MAAGYRFRVSIDNLTGTEADTASFKEAVYRQVKAYCENGLPVRTALFREALLDFYNTKPALCIEDFNIDTL
jgi:Uncharacterized protein conserved in bacteria